MTVMPEPLAEPLKRPLVFGDAEQIAALKLVKAEIEEEEETERQKAEGTLKEYQVTIELYGEIAVFVLATSKPEAVLLGKEMVNISSSDIEIENTHAMEVN